MNRDEIMTDENMYKKTVVTYKKLIPEERREINI